MMSEPLLRLLDRFPALSGLRRSARKTIPQIQQAAAADCGAACLAMVLAYHGKPLRLDEIRDVSGSGRDGLDAFSILRVARHFGLRARGVQVEAIEALEYLEPGSILHWNFDHFVVLEKSDRHGAWVVDPASGRRKVPAEELRRSFTGVALTFEPGEEFEPEEARPRGLRRYVQRLLAQPQLLLRVMALSLLLQILGLAPPVLTGVVVDRVVPRGDYHLLSILGAGLAGIVLFQFLSSLVRAHLLVSLRTRFDAQVTLEFLEHLVELPYAFFQQRSAGDLMMRLNSHSTIREVLTSNALSGLLDGSLVVLYLAVLLIADWRMGLVVLGLGGLRLLLFLFTRKRHRDLMAESLQAQAQSRGFQVQLLSGIETLKSVGAEQRAVDRWSDLFVGELNVSLARGRLNAAFDSLLSTLGMASPLAVLAFGGWLVLEGHLSLGTMLALNALAMGFLQPLSTLVETGVQFQLLGGYLDRINDVLETEKEEKHDEVAPAPRLRGRLSLEDVSFRYAPISPMVVRSVSVNIDPGRFIAIVGPSGAGKTSLAHLLVGLYRPSEGRVLYDGLDLATLELRSVRRQMGIVTQQPYLFGGSVRSNIALADPETPMARIVEAARLAQIHEDISAMPMGYDTVVADGGSSLSVGQRQRLALARALVVRPAILLLDEATSNLDAMTEAAIQEGLAALHSTRIVIAHRLSTVRNADQILVMQRGSIVEEGRHADLMAKGGLYRRLVATQVEDQQKDLIA